MKHNLQKLSQASENSGAMRRILMATHGTLFDEGVANILTQKADLEVWGVKTTDAFALVRAAAEINPDVILLFYTEPEKQKRLAALLDSFPNLHKVRVILLHLEHYSLHVYSQKHWYYMEGGTFFKVVYGNYLNLPDGKDFAFNTLAQEFSEKWIGGQTARLEIRQLVPA